MLVCSHATLGTYTLVSDMGSDFLVELLWDYAVYGVRMWLHEVVIKVFLECVFVRFPQVHVSRELLWIFANAVVSRTFADIRYRLSDDHLAVLALDPHWCFGLRQGDIRWVHWTARAVRASLVCVHGPWVSLVFPIRSRGEEIDWHDERLHIRTVIDRPTVIDRQ